MPHSDSLTSVEREIKRYTARTEKFLFTRERDNTSCIIIIVSEGSLFPTIFVHKKSPRFSSSSTASHSLWVYIYIYLLYNDKIRYYYSAARKTLEKSTKKKKMEFNFLTRFCSETIFHQFSKCPPLCETIVLFWGE